MFAKSLAEIEAQQLKQIFAILDSCGPEVSLTFASGKNGRKVIRIKRYDSETDETEESVVSGSSARDVFAQAAQVLP